MSRSGAVILVVDDEREIVRALSGALKAHGYAELTAVQEKVLDPSMVTRIWQDFEPYRKLQAQATATTP